MITRRSLFGFLALLPFIGHAIPPPEEAIPKPTHRSIKKVFNEIRAFVKEHPGAVVLSADDPRWLFLGWSAYKVYGEGPDAHEVSRHWTVHLKSVLNRDVGFLAPDLLEAVNKVGTQSGRQALCEVLAAPHV